jgi:hypothetical protein
VPLHEGKLDMGIIALLYLQLNRLVNVLPNPYCEDFLHYSTEIHSYILLLPTLKTITKLRTWQKRMQSALEVHMYIPPTKLWNGFKQNERLQTKVNNNTAGI